MKQYPVRLRLFKDHLRNEIETLVVSGNIGDEPPLSYSHTGIVSQTITRIPIKQPEISMESKSFFISS